MVVFASFLIIPAVVSSVSPLVSYGSTVQIYATQYAAPLAFAQAHPDVVAGGIIVFLLSIPLLRGRWRPRDAKRDEEAHEVMVAAELAKLNG